MEIPLRLLAVVFLGMVPAASGFLASSIGGAAAWTSSRLPGGVSCTCQPAALTKVSMTLRNPTPDSRSDDASDRGRFPEPGHNSDASWYSELRQRGAVVAELQSEDCSPLTPGLRPTDVVNEVLQALQHNNWPYANHGCAVALRFSRQRGFGDALVATAGELAESLAASSCSLLVEGFDEFSVDPERGRFKMETGKDGWAYAVVEAILKGSGGRMLKLHWRLSKDPFVGCWLTDKVDTDMTCSRWLRDLVRPENSECY